MGRHPRFPPFAGPLRGQMRKSSLFLLFTLSGWLILCWLFIDAYLRSEADLPRLQEEMKVAKVLSLTDLCLTTEARYTRNPSQSDWHSPFQNHPGALDSFPTGSIIQPPGTIIK
jgi:hypothetical protein